MFAFLCGARKFTGAIVAMLSLLWLTACGGGITGIGGGGPTMGAWSAKAWEKDQKAAAGSGQPPME